MGFLKPKAGKCTIDGLDCWREREKVQARLGYIPGEISFFDDMTGTEFLKFIAQYRKISTQSRKEELLERFELDPKSKIKKMTTTATPHKSRLLRNTKTKHEAL